MFLCFADSAALGEPWGQLFGELRPRATHGCGKLGLGSLSVPKEKKPRREHAVRMATTLVSQIWCITHMKAAFEHALEPLGLVCLVFALVSFVDFLGARGVLGR